MLEILLIQGELGHIFKERVFIFLEMIPFCLIIDTWLLYMILIHIIMLGMIVNGKLQWMKSSTLSEKMQPGS